MYYVTKEQLIEGYKRGIKWILTDNDIRYIQQMIYTEIELDCCGDCFY